MSPVPGSGVPPYAGWPAEARDTVERSVSAHGGRARWHATGSIQLPFRTASGMLLALKGYRRTFGPPRAYEVRPHARTTILHGYPDEGHRGLFVDGAVRIEALDGRTIADSPRHRDKLKGWARNRRWTPVDALYFFGYALWHYHVVPFTLGEARFVRRVVGGVEVEFPEDVHTHCRRQRFFFDGQGRIARHDYVADVIGWWARGCHLWQDYQGAGGLEVARRRRVVLRLFGRPTPLTALHVELGGATTKELVV